MVSVRAIEAVALILAMVFFLFGAFGVPGRIAWGWLGAFFLALTFLVGLHP